jgi:hypothetical protein
MLGQRAVPVAMPLYPPRERVNVSSDEDPHTIGIQALLCLAKEALRIRHMLYNVEKCKSVIAAPTHNVAEYRPNHIDTA